jgi:2-isopropylmalate synthase
LEKEADIDSEGKWIHSIVNTFDEVTSEIFPPNKVTIMDQTLREGESTPDVSYLSQEDKLEIGMKLADVGVEEVDLGYIGSIDEHYELCKVFKEEGIDLIISSHTRLWSPDYKKEIDKAYEAGADVISLIGCSSYVLHEQWSSLPREEVPERTRDMVRYANEKDVKVAYGLGAWNPTFEKCYQIAAEEGIDRAYIYDGKGWLSPEGLSAKIDRVKTAVGPDPVLALHQHNDFGLGVANTLKAVMEGVEIVDLTVNELGHRAGNASFEQTVIALEVLYGVDTGIKISEINNLCKLVAEKTGISITPRAPHVGEKVYTHSGIHANLALKGVWHTYENVKAETLNQKRQLQIGMSGIHRDTTDPVSIKLDQMGYDATEEEIGEMTDAAIRQIQKTGPLSEEDIGNLIQSEFGEQLDD